MNGFGNWFRQFRMKLAVGLRKFMHGRYGTDKLNTLILTTGLIICLVGCFFSPVDVDLLQPYDLGHVPYFFPEYL